MSLAKTTQKKPIASAYSQGTAPEGAGTDSNVLCEECEVPIPLARLRLVPTKLCVVCMEGLELQDKINRVRCAAATTVGTVRHQMEFEVKGVEEVESIELHIRRRG